MVPFFYVAKGDSIPKHIHRQKPAINSNEAVILFSTINDNRSKLKTTGVTDGANCSCIQKILLSILCFYQKE